MPSIIKNDYFTKEQEQTARFAKAIGHPVRIAILELLNSQACCYHGDMADELPIAKSTLSQHLNELKMFDSKSDEIRMRLMSLQEREHKELVMRNKTMHNKGYSA